MAGRATGNRAGAAAPRGTSGRAPVRDFTGGSATFAIEWDVRPAYDAVFGLAPDSGATEDLPAADRQWLKEARAAVPAAALDDLLKLGHHDSAIQIGAFVVEHAEVRHAADLVPALRSAGPGPLLRAMLGDRIGSDTVAAGLLDQAIAGDQAAKVELSERMPSGRKGDTKQVDLTLLDDPEATMATVLAVLEPWTERFARIEPRIEAILQRDYDLRAADRALFQGTDLIERTTAGIRAYAEPATRRIILAPSYFARPFNYLLAGPTWRFFGYPVADAAIEVDPLQPPAAVVRLHRALGDPTRLRILRLLADRDYYGTELAELLELSKPTIAHHLAQLRAAGLVTAIESGSVVYYNLRRERLADAATDLTHFLVG